MFTRITQSDVWVSNFQSYHTQIGAKSDQDTPLGREKRITDLLLS